MIVIDGAEGEGGGQMLRTSLALALITGKAFRIERARARREKPGLRKQHLTAVEAAAEVGGAEVRGAEVGSQEIEFRPGRVRAGRYRFAIGTAGSTTLVLQTVLPALALADGPSTVALEGGTYNRQAPPYDFLERSYVPMLERMGPRVRLRLERAGFYPPGGGRLEATIEPVRALRPLELLERGAVRRRRAIALVARLPESIGRRELDVAARELGLDADEVEVRAIDALSPGNALLIEIASEHATELASAIGERGLPAEAVAAAAAAEARAYLAAGVPVGVHLADQLLLLLAIAGGGRFRTLAPSLHTTTQIDIIRRFLDVAVRVEPRGAGVFEVAVERSK